MSYTTIDYPEAYFQVRHFTGTGSSQAYTLDGDTNLQPDLVWFNCNNTEHPRMYDAVRGVQKHLRTSGNFAEGTDGNGLTAFGSDGWTHGSGSEGNPSSVLATAWCWKAGAGSGSSNEAGSINTTSTSVDTTSKFSISTYTGNDTAGATIGHGIGSAPHFVIVKSRSHAQHWAVYHHKNTSAPETDVLILSNDGATSDSVNRWNDTAPSSTLITFGQENQINGPSYTYVAYAWSEVQGFSKFGSYTGNGNADGTFIYTGFRPAWVMTKRTDSTSSWHIYDNKRDTYNLVQSKAVADDAVTYASGTEVDFVSNGVKIRGTGSDLNASGGSFIFMAFAHSPFVNSEGIPCNAR